MGDQAWLQYGSFGLLAAGLFWASRVISKLADRSLVAFDSLSAAVDRLSASMDGAEARAEKRHGEVMTALASASVALRLESQRNIEATKQANGK